MRELELIDKIRKRAGKPGKGLICGIGDDCAVLEYTKAFYLLWAVDMLIEGTHFNLKKASYRQVGEKAVLVNISDIAAMGGIPKYIVVSLGLPSNIKNSAINKLYDGIFNICKKYNIKVVGGDTNRSEKFIIDVSIIGIVEKNRLATRNGAKEGELILVTGPVRDGKKVHLDFEPRLKEARSLTSRYKISSMIDTSDGITMDLGRLCYESKVGCKLYEDSIPLSKGLTIKDALYYGESFELLFTMAKQDAKKLLNVPKNRRKYFVIGGVVKKKEGLRIIDRRGHTETLKLKGYEHLQT